jgi:D-beta-D-heptose 7-phosphate kinase/D-beta-D-heptose 1-phosphate adenosyltransferase
VARIAVIGDRMLDEWVEGSVFRLCPEAPVPVIHNPQTVRRSGGAGHVVRVLETLGHQVDLWSVFEAHEIVKRRFVGGGRTLLRVDVEPDLSESVLGPRREALLKAYDPAVYDLVVISDYGKGTVPRHRLLADWLPLATGRPVVVDTKRGVHRFEGATVVKINEAVPYTTGEGNATVLQTLGSKGARLYETGTWHLPTHVECPSVGVTDPTGAGDVVTGWLAHGILESGFELVGVQRALVAASVSVQYLGTYAPGPAEVDAFLQQHGWPVVTPWA